MPWILSTRRVFAIVLVLGFFVLAARNVVDPDVWWHLKTGKYIAAHHAVPHTDPFSFTRTGQPWIAHEWLSDFLIYTTYRLAGFAGLIVIFAAMVAAAFFLLYLRAGINSYCAGFITLWGAFATAPLWGVRPQVISLLLNSLWLLILERSEQNRKLLWWTLPLTVLWVNLHAGFALGIALIALFLAGELAEKLFRNRRSDEVNSRLRALGLAFILNLVLVPLNPNGAKLYSYPFQTLHSRAMQTYIAEWASPNFHKAEYWPFLFLILALIATAAWSPAQPRLRDLLLLVVSTFAALSSIRLIPLFVLIAIPAISKAINQRRISGPNLARPRRPMPYAAFWNAIVLLAVAIFAAIHVSQVIRQQSATEAKYFPVAAVSYLQSHPVPGSIFNAYDWGGYLIWRLGPNLSNPGTKVFIDGRADLYDDGLFDDFADTYQLRGDWRKSLIQWQIKGALIPENSALANALRVDSTWSIAYADKQAIIFLRQN